MEVPVKSPKSQLNVPSDALGADKSVKFIGLFIQAFVLVKSAYGEAIKVTNKESFLEAQPLLFVVSSTNLINPEAVSAELGI